MEQESSQNHVLSWRDTAKRHEGILVFSLLFLITVPMLTKIFTSDFGTHIALGREIIRTMSVPDMEFLNYPSLGVSNPNGEWGFQAVLYLVFSVGGVYGVSLLCWVVVFGIFLFIHRASVLRGADPVIAVVAIFAFSGFLRIRIQPRPEIFTYLFTALSIWLFSEYFFGKRKKLVYLFPPMVLIWANMHPTYLMGFLLCGAFFTDGLARSAWKREFRWDRLRTWVFPPLLVGVAGLILCGLNPHGYDAILAPLHLISRGASEGGSSVLMSISELTPVKGTGFYVYYKAAIVFAAVSLLLGAVGRRIYFLDLFFFAIAFKGAWDSARAVSMMGLFLSPGISLHLTGFIAWIGERSARKVALQERKKAKEAVKKTSRKKATGRIEPGTQEKAGARLSRVSVGIVALTVVPLLVLGVVTMSFSFQQLEYGVGLTEHKFSLPAAEFLRKNPIPGNMFNFFDVGGFLDWQLYPQALTFIDGRTYNADVFMEHQMVTGAMQGWENVFQKYGVTYVVTKTMDSSGWVLPIIQTLTNDSNWVLVFADGLFVIFVKNIPENREYIQKFGLSKTMIPRQIIWESYHYMYLGVSPVMAYQNMSNGYMWLGDKESAVRMLRKAVEESGGDPNLRRRLMQLESGGTDSWVALPSRPRCSPSSFSTGTGGIFLGSAWTRSSRRHFGILKRSSWTTARRTGRSTGCRKGGKSRSTSSRCPKTLGSRGETTRGSGWRAVVSSSF
jgi:hypothetical protein